MNEGLVFVISGPSGVGKGTIIKQVMAQDPKIKLSISATTRAPRPGEENDVHYHFFSKDEFDKKIEEDAFIEWANVHHNKYGTLRDEVDGYVKTGNDVILEIDIQGARQVRSYSNRVFTIFITPPNFQDLFKRLKERDTEASEVIESRLRVAGKELAAIGEYDYIVVNDTIENATHDVMSIIKELREDRIG